MGLADRDWYRESLRDIESGGRSRSTAGHASRYMRLHPLAAIALTLIGVVLVYAIGASFVEWRTQRALESIRRASEQRQRDAQVRASEIQRAAAERQEKRAADARARRLTECA